MYFPPKFSHNYFLAFCLKQAFNYNLQFLVTTNLFHYLFWKVEIVLVYLKKRWMYFSKVFINTTMQTQYQSPCIRLHLYIQSIQCRLFVYLFFWSFSSHSRIFHLFGDVPIAGEGLQNFTYARHSGPLSSEGSLACDTYCYTWHPFIMVISEDLWHS